MVVSRGQYIQFTYGSPVAIRTGRVVKIENGGRHVLVDHGNGLYRRYFSHLMLNPKRVGVVRRVLNYARGVVYNPLIAV